MKQGQKSIINRLISNNGGQAVVEYILLSVIIVSLIIGMGKVFTALDEGFNQYLGGYIACLMEYGELPSLGVQAEELKKHTNNTGKKCDAQFAAFTFTDGRPSTNSGGSNGGSGGSGSSSNQAGGGRGNNGDGRGNGSGGDGGSGNKVSSSDDDDGENDTANGIMRGSGGRGRGDRKGRSSAQGGYATADSPIEAEDSRTRVIEDEEDSENAAKNNSRKKRNLTNNRGYEPYRAVTGRMKQEFDKAQKRRPAIRQPSRTVTALSKDEERFVPVRKIVSRTVAADVKARDDNEAGLSFGNFIRWILIAGVVVAIVIFFGGQVLNYSNSKD